MEDQPVYIEITREGHIVLQDPSNRRYKFLTPPINARIGMKWHSLEDLSDYLFERYQWVGWIDNEEGVSIDLS